MAAFGFNIDGMFTTNEDRNWLEDKLKTNPPSSLVVLSDIHYLIRLRNSLNLKYPVLRKFWGNEFDNIYRTTSVDEFLYIYKDALDNNLIVYSSNEPAEYLIQNDIQVPNVQLFEWEYELSRKILERGKRAVQFNWSVGMPHEKPSSIAHWRKNLEIISINRGKLFLGLHEYWFGWPFSESTNSATYNSMYNYNPPRTQKNFIIGRYRWILEYARNNFGITPDIIFTESGWDEVYDLHHRIHLMHNYKLPYRIPNILPALDFWSNLSTMQRYDYAFSQFRFVWDKIYKYDSEIKGICFFPFGGIGAWDEMSIHRHKPLVEKLIEANFNTVAASPIVEDKIMLTNAEATHILYTGTDINLRNKPTTTNSSILFTVTPQTEMFLFEKEITVNNNYTWNPAMVKRNGKWTFGYLAVSISGFNKEPFPETSNVDTGRIIELADEIKREAAG